jgi:hypothetical protein
MRTEPESEILQIRPLADGNMIDVEARSPQAESIDMHGVPLSDYPAQPSVIINELTGAKDPEHLYPKFDDMRFPRIALILTR